MGGTLRGINCKDADYRSFSKHGEHYMSTRSITHIHESHTEQETIVCSFYRHHDGYPEGHGKDLQEWLKGKRLINGISSDFVEGRDFNRAGTMAVALMSHIQSISGCEVIPTGDSNYGEEYTYHVYFRDGAFVVEATSRI